MTIIFKPGEPKKYPKRDNYEVWRLEFKDGGIEHVNTIRCRKHLHCECGLGSTLVVLRNKLRLTEREIVKKTRLITRETFHNRPIHVFGPVDLEAERICYEKLKKFGKKKRGEILKKYGTKINFSFHTVPDDIRPLYSFDRM